MTDFFFYNNLKENNLLKEIHDDYQKKDSYIYVKDYQDLNNIIIDTDVTKNIFILNGKYVSFLNITLDEILHKINGLNIGKKDKYEIRQIKCYIKNSVEKYVYLII